MAEMLISSLNIEEAITAIAKCFPSVKVLKTGSRKATISGETNVLDKIKTIMKTVVYEPILKVPVEIIEKERKIQATMGPECCRVCESRECFGCPGAF